MKIRLDWLNKDKEVRHAFIQLSDLEDCELLGFDIRDILDQGGTDLHIYKL